jgi:hypothetical protein
MPFIELVFLFVFLMDEKPGLGSTKRQERRFARAFYARLQANIRDDVSESPWGR